MLPPAPGRLSTTTGCPSDLGELLRDRAGKDVRGAAGGKGNDDADRLGWIRLRRNADGESGGQRGRKIRRCNLQFIIASGAR